MVQLIYWALLNSFRNVKDSVVKESMQVAFNEWEKYFLIKFIEKTDKTIKKPNDAILEIAFHCGSSSLCKSKFDGRGGIIAHGTSNEKNIRGRVTEIHFDCDENWIFKDDFLNVFKKRPVFYITAIHEIGHCLGLDHINNLDAIMYPNYSYMKSTLSRDDIFYASKLYELRPGVVLPQKISSFEAFLKVNFTNIILILTVVLVVNIIYKQIRPFCLINK